MDREPHELQAAGGERCSEIMRPGMRHLDLPICHRATTLTCRIQAREVLQDESNVQPVVRMFWLRMSRGRIDVRE